MTDQRNEKAPILALVDDDIHSARLFMRTLKRTGSLAQVKWLGNAQRAMRLFDRLLTREAACEPDMVVVDLKANSDANQQFLGHIAGAARAANIPVTVMAAGLAPERRQFLHATGAAAIFDRHSDRDLYRDEIMQISHFWVRQTSTWPIRA